MNTKQIKERLEHVAKAYVPHSELAADALEYISQLERQLAAPAELPPLTDEQILALLGEHGIGYAELSDPHTSAVVRPYKPDEIEAAGHYLPFARALLAQRAAPHAQGSDTVPMPQNADQAAAMAILGHKWLETHAPERLKAAPQEAPQQEPVAQQGFWDVYEPNRKEIYATVFNSLEANSYAKMGYRVVEQAPISAKETEQ